MPSPFPGMDPYLERPEIWRGFHTRFLTVASGVLNRDLSSNYYVEVDERLYVVGPEDESYRLFLADLAVLHETRQPEAGTTGDQDWGELAVTAPTLTLQGPLIEVRETFLRVERTDSCDVVTVIELLSPTNKHPGTGRRVYEEKRRKLLSTGVSLLEIDLLRDGASFLPAAADAPHDYSVMACEPAGNDQAQSRRTRIWLFDVQSPLPRIPVPLQPEDGYIALDLQAVFDETWRIACYEKRIDYSNPPPPPLSDQTRVFMRSRGIGGGTAS